MIFGEELLKSSEQLKVMVFFPVAEYVQDEPLLSNENGYKLKPTRMKKQEQAYKRNKHSTNFLRQI